MNRYKKRLIGMVILVESVPSFQRMVSSHLEEGIRILVKSEGTTRFVFVRKPQ